MRYLVGEIAKALGAEAAGDLTIKITSPAEPARAQADQIALAMEPSYGPALAEGKAQVAILWPGADWQALGLKAAIFAPRSRYLLSGVTRLFDHPPEMAPGIHSSAVVARDAKIGKGCAIGPFVVIGAGVVIGSNARIMSHCSIGAGARIGRDALLFQGVRVGARVQIGDRFIAQPGAVIGADGFSFVTPKPGAVERAKAAGAADTSGEVQEFVRINSLGAVEIGDDVEIGANSTIDRGTIANTVIGNGTKLDNLVHVGHNVRIGRTCLICGQVGIAGSSTISDRVVLGGQVGVADHINIGADVIVAGKAGISSHVPSGRVMMGNPAMPMAANVEAYKALRRLPRTLAKLEALQKRVSKLEPKG